MKINSAYENVTTNTGYWHQTTTSYPSQYYQQITTTGDNSYYQQMWQKQSDETELEQLRRENEEMRRQLDVLRLDELLRERGFRKVEKEELKEEAPFMEL